MAITLNFGAHMISQETFTDDHQKILNTIYEKDKQAKRRNEKIDLILRGLKLNPTFVTLLPLDRVATLDLSSCGLGAETIACLMEAIQTSNLPLLALDLSNNPIGPEGARALSEALAKLPQLRSLNLSNTQLNDEGMREIAKGLKGKSLKHLDLSFLKISDKETALAIGGLTVKDLELNGHQFSSANFEIIRAAIQKQNGELAATTVFTPENGENSEYLKYKEELQKINLSGANFRLVGGCAQERSAPDVSSSNNESGNVFSTVVQNC